jgi:hypothetical protein
VKGKLLALAVALAAVPAFAEGTSGESSASSNPGLRKRYDPGFAIGAVSDVRGFEGLNGAATSAGASVGWAWDPVDLNLQVMQALAVVGERKPTYLKANIHYAFATFAPVSINGTTGIDYVLHGPDRQTTMQPGNMIGPELGLGVRIRVMPMLDILADATAGLWQSSGGPHRMYFEPGVQGALQFHPFGSSD